MCVQCVRWCYRGYNIPNGFDLIDFNNLGNYQSSLFRAKMKKTLFFFFFIKKNPVVAVLKNKCLAPVAYCDAPPRKVRGDFSGHRKAGSYTRSSALSTLNIVLDRSAV